MLLRPTLMPTADASAGYRLAIRWIRTALRWPLWMAGIAALPSGWIRARPSRAAIRLQLAEAVREERASGKKVGSTRKRELKEAITARLTARAEFVSSVIDCIWDAEKGRLLVGSASARAVQPVLELFKATFGMDITPIAPAEDMPKLFAAILRGEGYVCGNDTLHPTGSASGRFRTGGGKKAAVAVRNSLNAVTQALEEGMAIQKCIWRSLPMPSPTGNWSSRWMQPWPFPTCGYPRLKKVRKKRRIPCKLRHLFADSEYRGNAGFGVASGVPYVVNISRSVVPLHSEAGQSPKTRAIQL